jgi:NitT/TauT family transport system ATP-binding protein
VVVSVGLGGFGDAYPRELSGGMKQRAGMARALSVDPELLFMDEPFSHVDALTAESLRAEVVHLWASTERNPSAIVLVSHDIKEVAWMADRIVVLSANPGRVSTIVQNPLPRPRDYRSRELNELIDQLHDVITGHELPDAPPRAGAPETGEEVVEPIPAATPSEIVGLLEYLDARGGRDDVFRIASDTVREFGHVIAIVQAAEILDLVDTPRRAVVLEQAGREFLAAAPDHRKRLWAERLAKLKLFADARALVAGSENQRAEREQLLELIVMHMPQEHYEQMFDRLIRWSRYGDFLAYDETTQVVSLPEPDSV